MRALAVPITLTLAWAFPSSALGQTAELPPPPPAEAPTLPPPPPAEARPAEARPVDAAEPAPATGRRPAFWRERLRLLNNAFLPLPDRSRSGRRSDAVIQLVAGGLNIGLGFLFPGRGGEVSELQGLLWMQGGWATLQGLANLVIAPARERLAEEYAQLPMESAAQRRARVRFGEDAMDRMAADGQRRRILAGVAGVVYPLGLVGVLYRNQIFNGDPMPEPREFNYIIIGTVLLAAIPAVVSAFSASEEERLRDSYRRELRVLREGGADPTP